MNEHLIFYDAECPFCIRAVRYVISIDEKRHFVFAPLNGKMASEILIGPQAKLKKCDSLILVENYQSTGRKFSIRSKAILRIYWLCGKKWVGSLSFLPAGLGDYFYRTIAAHRHQFKLKMPDEPGPKDRFLP